MTSKSSLLIASVVGLFLITLPSLLHAQNGWSNYNFEILEIKGEFNPPNDKGTELVIQLFPDLKATITEQSQIVQNHLYSSADNSMPAVKNLYYTIKPEGPISGKGGGVPTVYISVNSQYIAKFYESHENDTARLKREFIGMLTHELTHAFQLEPKGCGKYDGKSEFWACIEGVADAMRYLSGDHEWKQPKPGGTYLSGYEVTGFFLIYLQKRFDPNFVMKFHETAAKLSVWSFDAAIKEVLGQNYDLKTLWDEYQQSLTSKAAHEAIEHTRYAIPDSKTALETMNDGTTRSATLISAIGSILSSDKGNTKNVSDQTSENNITFTSANATH